MNYFINIGITVLLDLLSEGIIPKKYVAGLVKLRNALNLALPPELKNKAGKGITIQ